MTGFSLKVMPLVSQWNIIRDQIEEISMKQRWTEQAQLDVILISEEWFMNIVEHSQSDPQSLVYVEIEQLSQVEIRILFSDAGIPFSPFIEPYAKIGTPSIDQELGGLGIHFIRSKLHRYHYKYRNQRNEVEMFYRSKHELEEQ